MKAFIINGEEYKVFFGHNALCALENKLGKSIAEIGDFSATQIQALFWAGLLAYRRNISYEVAGELIDKVDDYMQFITDLTNEFAESLMQRFKTTVKVETSKKK